MKSVNSYIYIFTYLSGWCNAHKSYYSKLYTIYLKKDLNYDKLYYHNFGKVQVEKDLSFIMINETHIQHCENVVRN